MGSIVSSNTKGRPTGHHGTGATLRVALVGASGRLGQRVRALWAAQETGSAHAPPHALDIHAIGRQERPGIIALDQALNNGFTGCDVVLDLSGPTPTSTPRPDPHAYGDLPERARAIVAAAGGKRVLLASSAAVYGPPADPEPLGEQSPLAPVSPYGTAKAAMEAAVAGIPNVTCLRIGNVAGADALLGGLRAGTPATLDRFPDGRTPRRSYIGGAQLGQVLAALLHHPAPLPPVLNIATPAPVEMAALLEAAGHPWQPRPAPQSAIASVALDTTLLQSLVPLAPDASTPAALLAGWSAP